jgi:DNA-directed RNA polymerase subunit beta'
MKKDKFFFNGCFDKNRIKLLISWSFQNCGEHITIDLVENLKNIGFNYATQAGVSLGIDDLKIPETKAQFIFDSDIQIANAEINYKQGYITGVEKFQQLIDTWHRISETLKQNVIQYFKITDVLNPVYMMAFSGARGNISQVRQLVGMRGLMSDPQGQILDFPIKSNFREGLTLTEYVISCYGARKGLVDTALKTANSGYLTRRLVDVSHHIIVCEFDCKTKKGVILNTIIENQKIIVPLENRLIGRILAENIYSNFSIFVPKKDRVNICIGNTISKNKTSFAIHAAFFFRILILSFFKRPANCIQNQAGKFNHNFSFYQLVFFLNHINIYSTKQKLIASKNQEISLSLAIKINSLRKQVLVRSPLTCEIKNSICQLCYGWSLAHGKLVSLGEAVGILAAQSIGEPGTQLTMRTFHTGGVFSGDMMNEIRAPFDGIVEFSEYFQGTLIRTPHGKIAFLTKIPGKFEFYTNDKSNLNSNEKLEKINFQIPAFTILFVRNKEYVSKTQIIAEFSSISFNQEQRIQANYDLNTDIEGQVFFKKIIVDTRTKKNKLISRTTANLGSIWIVSGKIYTQPVPIALFPQSGDLVNQTSIIGQYKTLSPYNGFFTFLACNSRILSTNKDVSYFDSQVSKLKNRLTTQTDFSTKTNLQLFKQNTNFFRFHNTTLFPFALQSKGKQNKQATELISIKNDSKKIKLNNNTIFLHHPFISFRIQSIQYKKIGYFFSLYPFKKTQFNLDYFFLSTSLHQKFSNSNKLQTTFYFQSFPKQYKTQTGGIVIYDNFYLNEKFYCGEIFWIDEESYIFHCQNNVYFPLPCKARENTFDFKQNFESWNNVKIYNWIRKKKFLRKFAIPTNPLIFNYNNQGKILNIYSKLSGFIETSGIDLFSFNSVLNSASPLGLKKRSFFLGFKKTSFACFPRFSEPSPVTLQRKRPNSFVFKETDKHETKKYKPSKRKTTQNTEVFKLDSNYENNWKTLFYVNKYKFETSGIKLNPIIFNFQLSNTKKNLNTPGFFFKSTSFYYHICKYLKKNRKVNKKLLKKNSLPFLQSQFPWFEYDQYNFFDSSINTSLVNYLKPSVPVFSIVGSNFFTFDIENKKEIPSKTKNKYKSILKFYQSTKQKLKKKTIKLNKFSFNSTQTKLNFLDKKKELIKVKIKPGWVYFPKNIKKAIQNHKLIIKPGEQCCDDILFDQYNVYIECLALKNFLNHNKKKIQITSKFNLQNNLKQPINFFLFNQNLKVVYVKKKNNDLINFLGMVDIYTKFSVNSNLKNLSADSKKIKQNFSNSITTSKLNINFLEILETIFKNTCNTEFFNQNFTISLFLLNSTTQNNVFNIKYTLFLLEKYIQKNRFEFLYLVQKKFKQNSIIKNKLSSQNNLPSSLLKIYNYKKIYFLENSIFLETNKQIINSVILHTNLRKKNFFSLFKPNFKIENKPSIQFDVSTNLLIEKYSKTKSILYVFLFRSANTFLPESCILIRKIRPYPCIYTTYYKKLLAQQNNTTFYSFKNQNTLTSGVSNLTKSLLFSKQSNTQLFSTTCSNDFFVKPYLKYGNCKKNISSKKNTILEFYIVFLIPLNYSINAGKVQLMFKSSITKLNLKTINFVSLFCNIQNKDNTISNLKTHSEVKLIPQQIYNAELWIKKRNNLNLNCIPYLNVSTFRKLQFPLCLAKQGNNNTEFSINSTTQLTCTKLLSYFQNYISTNTPVSLTKFFSGYHGEILETQIKSPDKKQYLVLTNTDQISFSIPNSFRNEMIFSKTVLGKYIHYGTQIQSNCAIPESGLIIQIEKSKITIRKAQPILFSSKGLVSVYHGDLVEKNALILRLFYQRLKTGDIVQGIPKIEQLFEARKTNQGELLIGSLHEELKWLFRFYKRKYTFQKAARKSLEKIQQIIVNNVQKVYQSQGVTIAEKHLEIIVRQMTSKVQIITGGRTNLLPGELIDLDWIEIVNEGIKLKKKKAQYKPVILGITKKSLETKSFISEASFQETTRILAKSAIEGKTDFLRGLKENVILGHLIPAGTGFTGKVLDPNKPKYFATNNYESYTVFRKIFLEITST